jgi:hypothetical protein
MAPCLASQLSSLVEPILCAGHSLLSHICPSQATCLNISAQSKSHGGFHATRYSRRCDFWLPAPSLDVIVTLVHPSWTMLNILDGLSGMDDGFCDSPVASINLSSKQSKATLLKSSGRGSIPFRLLTDTGREE